jgi:electron transfer flavoprotein alpha subunit
MANLLVFVDLRATEITAPSSFALGEGRRIADALGATVYAVLATGPIAQGDLDRVVDDIGTSGADKILFCSDPTLARPPLDTTHGPLLAGLADKLQPVLFLFPAGSLGPELGPPLAVRYGATYCPRAVLEVLGLGKTSDTLIPPRLVLKRRTKVDAMRMIDLGSTHRARPVVATVDAGPLVTTRPGGTDAELQVISCPVGQEGLAEEISSEPDDAARVELASAIVLTPATVANDAAGTALPSSAAIVAQDHLPASLEVACPRLVIVVAPRDVEATARGGHLAVGAAHVALGLSPATELAVTIAVSSKGAKQPTFANLTWPIDEHRAVGALVDAFRAQQSDAKPDGAGGGGTGSP